MERQLTEIVEKHLEGNYLVGSENKAQMISEILALFSVSKRCFKTKVNMKNRTSILVGTRHFFYALLATVLFSSCGGSTDKEACLSNVKEMFPKAKVYIPFEGSNTTFIVIDSVNVYMVKTMSLTSPRVTDVVVLRSK